MKARMTLGADSSYATSTAESIKKIVEELERMGWDAHFKYQGGNGWELIFTRELKTKGEDNE